MEIDVVEEEECDETEATEQELKRQPSIWEKKRLVCVYVRSDIYVRKCIVCMSA